MVVLKHLEEVGTINRVDLRTQPDVACIVPLTAPIFVVEPTAAMVLVCGSCPHLTGQATGCDTLLPKIGCTQRIAFLAFLGTLSISSGTNTEKDH